MRVKSFITTLLFIVTTAVTAQSLQLIQGVVRNTETQLPLAAAHVVETNSQRWTITDQEGQFKLYVPASPVAILHITMLGKEEQTRTLKREHWSTPLVIDLRDNNLRLDEVVINVKKGNKYSEISIGQEVIQQVQAFSLNEVLEQLPSQATTNLDFNEFKPIAFRTVRPSSVGSIGNAAFGNKSFGTAIVIDGIPVSNNENMQSYVGNNPSPFAPNYLGFGESSANDFNGYVSNANYGVDLREITTETIEKIEVVQGVPSARYGDLTSGLIKIQQKAGRTPFKLFTSLREGAEEYGFSKGFRLGERAGNLNISTNYLKSNTNPSTSFMLYKRISTNAMWSWASRSKNIKNSLSIDYAFNKDDMNFEAEDADQKILQNQKKDLAISNRFKWVFNEAFFDNLDINLNYRFSDQFTYESKIVNVGGSVVGTSFEEGVYEGAYTMPSYTTVKAVEGKPISGFFSADFFKTFSSGDWQHNLVVGTSARMSDNKGRGRLGEPETMINFFGGSAGSVSSGFRPYNYGENIRAEFQVSLYAEDNITRSWDNSTFNLNSGLRYDYMYGFHFLAPRINTYYQQDNFKIRGGFGLTAKAPSLNQIYTGPRFVDAVLGDYRYPGYYNLAIVQTFIDQADNKDLAPSKSLRSELGFDYALPFADVNVTAYYNFLYDGITSESYATARDVAQLEVVYNGTERPTWTVNGSQPYYYTQTRLVNGYESTDKGVEFMLSFDKIMPRNFAFGVNGSYIETKNVNKVDSFYRSTDPDSDEIWGVIKPYSTLHNHFRLGGYLNYHLPKIGLVIAVRSEHFFNDGYQYSYTNTPYAYIDRDLQLHVLSDEAIASGAYSHITGSSYYDERDLEKVYHNFNLRVSKDFFNGFRVSFYANNFLDSKQTRRVYTNGQYVVMRNPMMPALSFGTRIEYQF